MLMFFTYNKTIPIEILSIVYKPAIQYIVEVAVAVASSIEGIIVVTGKRKRTNKVYFDFTPKLNQNLKGKTIIDFYCTKSITRINRTIWHC